MDYRRIDCKNTDEVGKWVLLEARRSFRYWYSSMSCREVMKHPLFDKTQTNVILDSYSGKDEEEVA